MTAEQETEVHAVSEAELNIGSVTLRVFHLSNGKRVIDEQSMIDFMSALESGSLTLSAEDAIKVVQVIRS